MLIGRFAGGAVLFAGRHRNVDENLRAFSDDAFDRRRPPQQSSPFGDAAQTEVPSGSLLCVETGAGVVDSQMDAVANLVQRDLRKLRSAVALHVGQRLLHDAKERGFDSTRRSCISRIPIPCVLRSLTR